MLKSTKCWKIAGPSLPPYPCGPCLARVTLIRRGSFSKMFFPQTCPSRKSHAALVPSATNVFGCSVSEFPNSLPPWCLFWLTCGYRRATMIFPSVSLNVMDNEFWRLVLVGQVGLPFTWLCGVGREAGLLMSTLTGHHQVMLPHSPLWLKILLIRFSVFIMNRDF